jgi:hypothetical protein
LAFGQAKWFGLDNPNAIFVRISRFEPQEYVGELCLQRATENVAQGCALQKKKFEQSLSLSRASVQTMKL